MDATIAALEALRAFSTDETMARVVAIARQPAFGAAEVCCLAHVLAESGERLNWADTLTADLASTGGPSSLSTLLAPPFLAASGVSVVKLGVPGRPAGGIDVLAQIPGYNVELDKAEVQRVVGQCGYAHFMANPNFAPLDSKLFGFRQKTGAQNVAVLAAASLLAKKMACGVRYVGLDIRVAAHGNFGATIDEARHMAEIFREAAKLAGIKAICLLTDARFPYQPYIGRGEALVALREALTGTPQGLLRQHLDLCQLMAAQVGYLADNTSKSDRRKACESFRRNVEAQGGSWTAFLETAQRIESKHSHVVEAADHGFACFDLAAIRGIFGRFNCGAASDRAFPDDFGLILRVNPGEFVEKGRTLMTVRSDDSAWPDIRMALASAAMTSHIPGAVPGLECETRA